MPAADTKQAEQLLASLRSAVEGSTPVSPDAQATLSKLKVS